MKYRALPFLQWFLCPAELKIIWNHQWMALSPASSVFVLQALSPFTMITLSTPQFIPFSGILFNSSVLQLCQDFLQPWSHTNNVFSVCFVPEAVCWCSCYFPPKNPSVVSLTTAQIAAQGGWWMPWLSMTCHLSVPWASTAVCRAPGNWSAVESGWLFFWGPWSCPELGLQSISPCGEESKSVFSKGNNEAVV